MRYEPLLAVLFALSLAGVATESAQAAPRAGEPTAPVRSLQDLPRKPLSERTAVTIYQFRSGVAAVNNQAATDIFTSALIKSGQFRVVERAQLAPGVVAEKALNAAGKTTGDTNNVKLTAAKYIFEGAVSEGAVNADQGENSFSAGGATVTRGGASGSITIDVRIIDADTGDVLDSVTVSEPVRSSKSAVSGVGALLGSLGALKGLPSGLNPEINSTASHDDGLDHALRGAIDHAVLELVQRM